MAVRTNQLYNFKGEPYITRPELERAISEAVSNSIAVKPFVFDEGAMASSGTAKTIVVPGIVFNVFNNQTGIVYGDISYLSGADAGKTRITFENYADMDFGESPAFTAMAFVQTAGGPIPVLEPEEIE